MDIKIKIPESNEALTEFVRFYDQVYDYREARWPRPWSCNCRSSPATARSRKGAPSDRFSPAAEVKSLHAFTVMDEGYNRHRQEHLGHIILFEAIPERGETIIGFRAGPRRSSAPLYAPITWCTGETSGRCDSNI